MIKKKKLALGIVAVLLILCCIPIKKTYKDGGTVKYQAILWSYTRYHRLVGTGESYYGGTEFRIFPFNF